MSVATTPRPLPTDFADAVPLPDFGEGAVAVVVITGSWRWHEHPRNAVVILAQLVIAAAERGACRIIDKAAHEQIELPVVVVIEPDRAGGPAWRAPGPPFR